MQEQGEQDQARAEAVAAAAAVDLVLPEETIAGVVANRRLLGAQRALIDTALTEASGL